MINQIDFIGVPVRDMATAKQFYQETLGLKPIGGIPDKWEEYDVGGATVSLWMPEAFGMPFSPQGGFALGVADVPTAFKELQAKGVQFHGDVIDTPVCKMAMFQDPDGNSLMLHHRHAPEG